MEKALSRARPGLVLVMVVPVVPRVPVAGVLGVPRVPDGGPSLGLTIWLVGHEDMESIPGGGLLGAVLARRISPIRRYGEGTTARYGHIGFGYSWMR